jgi:hypothetical protein
MKKWNYLINMLSQQINSSVLKNLYEVKKETHMNKIKLNTNLVQHLCLDIDQERLIKRYL